MERLPERLRAEKAEAEIERLRIENERLRAELAQWVRQAENAHGEAQRWSLEVERLRTENRLLAGQIERARTELLLLSSKMYPGKVLPNPKRRTTMTDTMLKSYRELSPEEQELSHRIKVQGGVFLELIDDCIVECRDSGREFALAKTKLEEAVMWAVTGITK